MIYFLSIQDLWQPGIDRCVLVGQITNLVPEARVFMSGGSGLTADRKLANCRAYTARIDGGRLNISKSPPLLANFKLGTWWQVIRARPDIPRLNKTESSGKRLELRGIARSYRAYDLQLARNAVSIQETALRWRPGVFP
jgi:hypothetical protein